MSFLEWLEALSIAEWARSSLVGYPFVITSHSVGLAVMVGPVIMLNLRLLGRLKSVPLPYFGKLLFLSWIGFCLNFISGVILFTMEATSYVSDVPFLIKISLVFLGALAAAYQHKKILRHADAWEANGAPKYMLMIAMASIVFWFGAIIAGRLIAYVN